MVNLWLIQLKFKDFSLLKTMKCFINHLLSNCLKVATDIYNNNK